MMKKKNKTKKKILKETIIIQILMKMLKIFSEKYQKLKNVSYVQHIMYLYVNAIKNPIFLVFNMMRIKKMINLVKTKRKKMILLLKI